jgi:hypothetical protein
LSSLFFHVLFFLSFFFVLLPSLSIIIKKAHLILSCMVHLPPPSPAPRAFHFLSPSPIHPPKHPNQQILSCRLTHKTHTSTHTHTHTHDQKQFSFSPHRAPTLPIILPSIFSPQVLPSSSSSAPHFRPP